MAFAKDNNIITMRPHLRGGGGGSAGVVAEVAEVAHHLVFIG